MKKRILSNLASHGFGQCVTYLLQIIQVPILIHTEGTGAYSDWLILSTIPAILALANVGVAPSLGTSAVQALESGNHELASAFQATAWRWSLWIASIFFALSLFTATLQQPPGAVPLQVYRDSAGVLLCCSMIATVGLLVLQSMIRMNTRLAGRTSSGVMWINVTRLCSGGIFTGVLLFNQGLLLAAWLSLIATSAFTCFGLFRSSRSLRERLGPLDSTVRPSIPLRSALIPTLATSGLPVAQALIAQGTTLVLAHLGGASAVALYSSHRTISRGIAQIHSIACNSIWTEVASARTSADKHSLRRILSIGTLLMLLSAIVASVATWLVSPLIEQHWLRGAIQIDWPLLLILFSSVTVYGIWNLLGSVAVGLNRHGKQAILSVIAALLATTGFGLIYTVSAHLALAHLAILIGECVMLLFVTSEVRFSSSDAMWSSSADLPRTIPAGKGRESAVQA